MLLLVSGRFVFEMRTHIPMKLNNSFQKLTTPIVPEDSALKAFF